MPVQLAGSPFVSDQSILGQRMRPPSTYGAVSSHAPEGARANHTGIIGSKQMWEPACRRCAARAALGLTGAAFLSPYKWQPSRDPTAAPTNPIIRSMLRQQTSKDRIRAARCLPWFLRCCADRAPPARRFAAKAAPTLVSGQLCLWDLRANALAHASIWRRTNKAVARAWHRMDWPETNVGAALAAMRRAGGARSHRCCIPFAIQMAALTRPTPAQQTPQSRLCLWQHRTQGSTGRPLHQPVMTQPLKY